MKKVIPLSICLFVSYFAFSQERMTPELLWKLGRVSAVGISKDGSSVIYKVSRTNLAENTSQSETFSIPLNGGSPLVVTDASTLVADHDLSPDGKYTVKPKDVKVEKVYGKDFFPDMDKSDVQIYTSLMYRHWDHWEDGNFSHLFVNDASGKETDIMPDELFDCPQQPFGGSEDYTWSADSKYVVYVTKEKSGTAYALSTNTDLYSYDVVTGKTSDLTEGMNGYDTNPLYSSTGVLGWLSMKTDGYESDKNDIVVKDAGGVHNLTSAWDGTVDSFQWSKDGKKIYFIAPVDGTEQLFEIAYNSNGAVATPRQITNGYFDVSGLVGQVKNVLVVSRMDMNHAAELYTVNLADGSMQQLTHVNDDVYKQIKLSKIERRYVTTTDNQQMLVWVIYPPDFDSSKKYPTLLYCQGGPQSPLTQFYSFRWNFQLIAANGYIVVAPNRRGMQGHGVQWNEEISKDWGGQVIRDYLSAIDAVAKDTFVDKDRLGCVGASFGGYSVYFLAGMHQHRFKTFIAHDGVFDLKSMSGTTEELWFVNWELGGPYWANDNAAAMKSYHDFDPSNFVNQWDTPIMIIQGGHDYRVPIGQGLEAFQAAQLHGIKSKLLYFPTESHWVLSPQNAIVWQREFFDWLKETL